MIRRGSSFLKIFLAAVPVLYVCSDIPSSVFVSVLIIASFWGSVGFFRLSGFLFPRMLIKAAFILWAALLGEFGYYFLGVYPYWVISLIILMPDELFSPGPKKVLGKSVLRGLGLGALLIYVGVLHQVLQGRFLVWAFELPAGSFFLLAVAAFLWQNQPRDSTDGKETINRERVAS